MSFELHTWHNAFWLLSALTLSAFPLICTSLSHTHVFWFVYDPLILSRTLCMTMGLEMPTGALWAHPGAQHWSPCLSLLQNLQVANSSAEGMGLWKLLPTPWWTNDRPSGSNLSCMGSRLSCPEDNISKTFVSSPDSYILSFSISSMFPEPYWWWYKWSV